MSEGGTDDPLLGKVLSGRFQIVEPLGAGGMGRVYKAIQQPLDRVVALKVLNPRYDGTKDPGFERRFFLEASMTAKLKHPNTITVHDYGRTDDGIFFIAMEYLEGETLQQVLARERTLPWPRALAIASQVARSLREAHKAGMVHRDLKPANVMVMSEGTGGDAVKVLDFGLVKTFLSDKPKAPSDTELTQAGVLLGSPLYMAPEQARSESDPRTDLYSLGILIFQCVAGRPPFQGKESIDIIIKQIKERPPELRSLVPEVPLEVNALVMKCLEKAPSARFQSMDELLEAMRVAASGQGMSGLFIDPRTYSNPAAVSASQAVNGAAGVKAAVDGAASRSTSSSRVRLASPVDQDTRSERPVDLEVSSPSLEVEITESGAHRNTPNRLPLVLGVVGVVVVGVALGGTLAMRSVTTPTDVVTAVPTVAAEVKPPVVTAAPVDPPAEAAKVVFEVHSTPEGATVSRGDEPLGTTPFSFSEVVPAEGPTRVQVVLSLDGYLPSTVLLEGRAGTVRVETPLTVRPVATKQPPAKPNRPTRPAKNPNDTGYKDDPYQ